MFDNIINFFTFVGFYALSCYLYNNLRTPCIIIYRRIERILKNRKIEESELILRYGAWAAITGSSDGIGRAYARELARHGLNVVLIARNEQKLKAVAEQIESEFSVKTKVIVTDFTAGPDVYNHLERELDGIPIGLLINNVGTAAPVPGPFVKSSRAELLQIIDTNIVAVTELSRYFLKRMRSSNTKGCIVNVSSGTEMQPCPFGAVYAASKSYTQSLTLALQEEACPYGITIQLLSPNFVVTKINSYSRLIMRGGLFIPDADTYAKSAVSQLVDGADETSGYFWHAIQNAIFMIFPLRVRIFIIKTVFTYITDQKPKI